MVSLFLKRSGLPCFFNYWFLVPYYGIHKHACLHLLKCIGPLCLLVYASPKNLPCALNKGCEVGIKGVQVQSDRSVVLFKFPMYWVFLLVSIERNVIKIKQFIWLLIFLLPLPLVFALSNWNYVFRSIELQCYCVSAELTHSYLVRHQFTLVTTCFSTSPVPNLCGYITWLCPVHGMCFQFFRVWTLV